MTFNPSAGIWYNPFMEITSENIHSKLEEIQTLRETKGKEEETLSLIDEVLPVAQDLKDFDLVSTLYWEYALVWQHVVMNEMAKPEDEQDEKIMSDAKKKMGKFANKAHEVIEDNNLSEKLTKSYRFLGRVGDYNKNYPEAIKNYEKALELCPPDVEHSLEISGFLAYSLVMNGKVDEGMKFAKETFDSYFNSDTGKMLKKKDYFVWAVWMSGIAPRMILALDTVGAEYDSGEMKKWLEATKTELENPTGKVTWGDDKFQFRIDELTVALGKIAIIVLLPFMLKI